CWILSQFLTHRCAYESSPADYSSSHLLIFSSSHLPTFSSSHLPIFSSSHLPIFSSSHLLTFSSSHLPNFSSSPLLKISPSQSHPLSKSRLFPLLSLLAALFFFFFCCFFPLSAQTVRINEAMANNGATIEDEDGDSSDWLELFNASTSDINLYNYGLSDNRDDLYKWLLPDITMSPGEYRLIFASNKDRRIGHWETVIDWGAEWKYFLGFAEPPTDWRDIDFDDSSWMSGPSGIGLGDGDDATIIPAVPSYFMRHTFTVEDLSNIVTGLFHVDYDDAFVAYLNGMEIARANIGSPGIIPAYDDLAAESWEAVLYEGGSPEKFLIPDLLSFLVEGENVLCIQTHNNTPTGSDLTMIPFLTFGMITPPINAAGVNPLLDSLCTCPHTNFKIGSEGETLYLSDTDGDIIDSLFTTALPVDISLGRQPDGGNDLYFFNESTPGAENNTYGYQTFAEPPEIGPDGGFFTGSQTISLAGGAAGETIYYTLDGTDPNETCEIYTQPIVIDTTHVIRAKVFGPNSVPSTTITHTYFIDRDFTMPVISLATTPANFFDWETGIYVMGPNAASYPPYYGANFWQDWEKPVHVEMFSATGNRKFQIDAGVKIHGRWSRRFDQRSLALFFRSQYGEGSLNYQVFPEKDIDEFECLLLRNSGNDFVSTHFRDGFVSNLMQDQDILYQEFQPVIVYLNGMYWGIYNLREKVNEHFIASNCNVDPANLDILENQGEPMTGDSTAYHQIIDYMIDHDLSVNENYEYIKTKIAVKNLVKYLAANIYCNNSDWPRNNVTMWRERTDTGNLHWILDDMDWTFGYPYSGYDDDTIWSILSTDSTNANYPATTFLYRMMFNNAEFRQNVTNCILDYLNTIYQPALLLSEISDIESQYEVEMPAHLVRWNLGTMQDWYDEVEDMETFASLRPENMLEILQTEFGWGDAVNVNVDVNDESMGYVKLNFITLHDFPFNGSYLAGVPLKLTAEPYDGYQFTGWSGSSGSSNTSLQITPSGDINLTANFQQIGGGSSMIVINEINYNSSSEFDPGDWIEIYNNSNSTLDLSGWQFKDEDDAHIFTFPNGFQLESHQYYVLCQDSETFLSLFTLVENYLGDFEFGLSGSGEMLRIFDDEDNLID
ncbi:MAG TPA: CotH kinase family protein, partial [Candidatus Cloacimonadota bacterium]|nr:CotH kinase family protein [Candidatus Cloacimonadota bacterium]